MVIDEKCRNRHKYEFHVEKLLIEIKNQTKRAFEMEVDCSQKNRVEVKIKMINGW